MTSRAEIAGRRMAEREAERDSVPTDTERYPGTITLQISREDCWRLYDLVTGRSELIAAQEYQAMQNLGGSPWYALAKEIRNALESNQDSERDK